MSHTYDSTTFHTVVKQTNGSEDGLKEMCVEREASKAILSANQQKTALESATPRQPSSIPTDGSPSPTYPNITHLTQRSC
jgi:hypothetical protein